MDSNFSTTSLDTLQNAEQRKVLDVVDGFRRSGLSSILNLPQIVVCGDQSSGKSSVLEAITEIPFPRKENLCTRFATEIILKRDDETAVTTTITPDKTRPQAEQDKLHGFRKRVENLRDFAGLVEEATILMGLDNAKNSATKAFTRDVLGVEICGPDRPQLTLVDLPGVIQASSSEATDADVDLIQQLVKDYIANERTIILAVVSAKNDFNNQIVSRYCRDVDRDGSRTLGIVTKPDWLVKGSANEQWWVSLAQKKSVYFRLGWHMLKNRSEDAMSCTFQERNSAEKVFFSTSTYQDLPRDMLGIETLRTKLSKLLHNHLKKELPNLKKELLDELSKTESELSALGAKRATIAEQRQLLTAISMEFYELVSSAVMGHYEQAFFGPIDTKTSLSATTNLRRLRAVVQDLNLKFAKSMRFRGHKYSVSRKESSRPIEEGIVPKDGSGGEDYVIDSLGEPEDKDSDLDGGATKPPVDSHSHEDDDGGRHDLTTGPIRLTRTQAEDWVLKVLKRSRGRELPGNFNPMLISHLFWEQSEPWKKLANDHIDEIAKKCTKFVRLALENVATEDVCGRIWEFKVENALNNALIGSRAELAKVLKDKSRHPITYNHYYTMTIQKERRRNYSRLLDKATTTATEFLNVQQFNKGTLGPTTKSFISPQKLQQALDETIVLDMDGFSAIEALDSQQAYYKDEMKYFIGVITKQVIERHLVDPLPTSVLSPSIIAGLSDNEVAFLAAEPDDIVSRRTFLEERKQMLEKGQQTFRRAMGGLY
ncbi:Dynamin family protein [Viridothelium virens]|uniref:Dynamin family protein n=1 Tax=Viridothelium virens TaxID=1048519 RepID=A0A6A6GUQ1_VIRVR|nr:Dynamin family protein [Viridothelium virens]